MDVIAAERVLSEAKRDYARAKYEYIQNFLLLKQAAGSLSPDDLAHLNQWLAY
ncbi:outer membrane channel protein [compost metagenome]